MKAVLRLAALSAWSRRLTLGLTPDRHRAGGDAAAGGRAHPRRCAAELHAVGLGRRPGGRRAHRRVQLMLYAVFHAGAASNNIGWDSYQAIATHPAVDWAVPLSLGDSHRGFAVLGTSPDYFRASATATSEACASRQAKPFAGVFEAVLGSEVAASAWATGWATGSRSATACPNSARRTATSPSASPASSPPTGTPVDRTLHVGLEAITALHLDWVGGAPLPGVNIPRNSSPSSTSAEGNHRRAGRPQAARRCVPHAALRQPVSRRTAARGAAGRGARRTVADRSASVERTLLAVSALVVLVGLAGLTATLLAGLNERRRELAILRALGAGPGEVFLMLTAEGLLVTDPRRPARPGAAWCRAADWPHPGCWSALASCWRRGSRAARNLRTDRRGHCHRAGRQPGAGLARLAHVARRRTDTETLRTP
jgi:putative ABC transport system permease protein